MREKWLTAGLATLVAGAGLWAVVPKPVERGPISLQKQNLNVSVLGEVNKPGVYVLPFGSREIDAVRAAGGFTVRAEKSLVRLAELVEDGEQLNVPSKQIAVLGNDGNAKSVAPSQRINLNSATETELESLPGVGPKLAARIVAGRPYNSLEDLDKVKGVGPSMLTKLSPLVKF